VHRDLKPGNVMLQSRGAEGDFVKILDFGLVKLSDAPVELDLTHTGAILGSPRFMSPEQVQSQKVDHRSDIYSFGAVLYNMLAGKPPFNRGASFNILAAHINDAPPPLREYNPQCEASPRLENLVQWCLAKTPDGRPPSMDVVLAEIQECFDEMGLSTATLMSLAAAGGATTLGPALDVEPLIIEARYDVVQIRRGAALTVTLSGKIARLVSELVMLGGTAPWEVVAREIWADTDRESLRKKFDVVMVRLRHKLREGRVRPDLVRSLGTGVVELVVHASDRVVDAS